MIYFQQNYINKFKEKRKFNSIEWNKVL